MPDATAHPGATYCDRRRIGDATITVISEGVLPLPLDMIFSPQEAAWLREHGEAGEDGQRFAGGQIGIHVALGDAYSNPIADPADLPRINESQIHIDFMIGSDEVSVSGVTRDGDEVPLLVGGSWQV